MQHEVYQQLTRMRENRVSFSLAFGKYWAVYTRMNLIRLSLLAPMLAASLVATAAAAPVVQSGFVITYGAGYDPADFPNGNVAVYNQSFIDNYISLSGTYGGDPLFANSADGYIVRILAWWNEIPNTTLTPASAFGVTIVPQELVDGRFGGGPIHVSEDWLNAINADPTLQAQYGFEFKTQEWVNANVVPEPSTYALLLVAGVGAVWFARSRR